MLAPRPALNANTTDAQCCALFLFPIIPPIAVFETNALEISASAVTALAPRPLILTHPRRIRARQADQKLLRILFRKIFATPPWPQYLLQNALRQRASRCSGCMNLRETRIGARSRVPQSQRAQTPTPSLNQLSYKYTKLSDNTKQALQRCSSNGRGGTAKMRERGLNATRVDAGAVGKAQ
ncbi:MAG TPA: hypothetical protein VKB34_19615 [Povalibacter sp.]|nr:hypothetical protein [Povalibacter sp.]